MTGLTGTQPEIKGFSDFDKEADQDIIKDIDAAFEVKIIDPNEAEPVIVSLNPLADLMEETKEIAVRFARLRAPLHIEKYKRLLINYSDLDCYDAESFVEGLMRKVGDNMVKEQEKNEPIINKAEKITANMDKSTSNIIKPNGGL